MIYRLHCSIGNTVGLDDYLAYSEIDADGYWCRYLEFRADGRSLRYSTENAADHLGVLPEGVWDESEASKKEYGPVIIVSEELFNTIWNATRCSNDSFHETKGEK